MNILLLSVGTRNKIVQYFRENLEGKGNVIATDCSELAPALYEANKHYIVPKITDDAYIQVILDICKKENISGVLSLLDPEISILANSYSLFKANGIHVICSDYNICERCLDKWEMFKWLKQNNYLTAQSYLDKYEFYKDVLNGCITYPVFIKPVRGSASIGISKVYDQETIDLLFKHNDGLLIQEYLDGQEIGADCYIDTISGRVISIFTKKKLNMRAGETDKSVSFKDPNLFNYIERFIYDSGLRGQIDIDIFEINGKYYISEVNPRFGGGYPHAYECGVNNIKYIINNLEGKENSPNIGSYKENKFMMKYNELKIL